MVNARQETNLVLQKENQMIMLHNIYFFHLIKNGRHLIFLLLFFYYYKFMFYWVWLQIFDSRYCIFVGQTLRHFENEFLSPSRMFALVFCRQHWILSSLLKGLWNTSSCSFFLWVFREALLDLRVTLSLVDTTFKIVLTSI